MKIGEETFKTFDADCVTLNGYMGSDSINPFLKAAQGEDKCVFVLVKTSNPGSGELQDMVAGDRLVYQVMGDLNQRIAKGTEGKYGYTMAGAVTGATYPSDIGPCASAWSTPSSWCPATAPRGDCGGRTVCL